VVSKFGKEKVLPTMTIVPELNSCTNSKGWYENLNTPHGDMVRK